jgi:hypothetical protein
LQKSCFNGRSNAANVGNCEACGCSQTCAIDAPEMKLYHHCNGDHQQLVCLPPLLLLLLLVDVHTLDKYST